MKIHWRYSAVALLIGFFLGAGSGLLMKPFYHPIMHKGDFQHKLERFSTKLSLTSEQKDHVGMILKTNREKLDQIKAEMESQMQDVRKTTHDQIRAVLTPEQQFKFDALHTKMEAHFKRHFFFIPDNKQN